MSDVSDRSRGVALVLATVLGWAGGHRFYAGKIGTGFLMLMTGGGFGVWWLVDWISILAGSFRDIDGKKVLHWGEGLPAELGGRPDERLEAVLDELEAVRSEMGELHERMDFVERMLTRVREREALPPR